MTQCPEYPQPSRVVGTLPTYSLSLKLRVLSHWLLVLVCAAWPGQPACLGIRGHLSGEPAPDFPLLAQLWSKGRYSTWVWVMVIWKMGFGGKNRDGSLGFSHSYSRCTAVSFWLFFCSLYERPQCCLGRCQHLQLAQGDAFSSSYFGAIFLVQA